MEVIFVVIGIIIVLMLMVFMFRGNSSCTSTSCTNGNTCSSSGSCMCGTSAACAGNQVCNGESCENSCTPRCTNGNTCGSSGSCMCGTSTACTGNQVCNGGSCENSCTPSCTNGNTCGSSGSCMCGTSAACTGNQVCYYDKCVTPTSATACTKPSDCGTAISTTDCVGGVCLQKPPAYGCNPGCADGYTCFQNKCSSFYGVELPSCATSPSTNACPSGTFCGLYSCTNHVTACSSDSDCKAFGSDTYCLKDSSGGSYCAFGNSYSIYLKTNTQSYGGTQYGVGNTCAYGSTSSSIPLLNYTCDTTTGYYTCGSSGACPYGQVCSTDKTCVADTTA